jgi:hypothetical protein
MTPTRTACLLASGTAAGAQERGRGRTTETPEAPAMVESRDGFIRRDRAERLRLTP